MAVAEPEDEQEALCRSNRKSSRLCLLQSIKWWEWNARTYVLTHCHGVCTCASHVCSGSEPDFFRCMFLVSLMFCMLLWLLCLWSCCSYSVFLATVCLLAGCPGEEPDDRLRIMNRKSSRLYPFDFSSAARTINHWIHCMMRMKRKNACSYTHWHG